MTDIAMLSIDKVTNQKCYHSPMVTFLHPKVRPIMQTHYTDVVERMAMYEKTVQTLHQPASTKQMVNTPMMRKSSFKAY